MLFSKLACEAHFKTIQIPSSAIFKSLPGSLSSIWLSSIRIPLSCILLNTLCRKMPIQNSFVVTNHLTVKCSFIFMAKLSPTNKQSTEAEPSMSKHKRKAKKVSSVSPGDLLSINSIIHNNAGSTYIRIYR